MWEDRKVETLGALANIGLACAFSLVGAQGGAKNFDGIGISKSIIINTNTL